jgi:hypothetical protein
MRAALLRPSVTLRLNISFSFGTLYRLAACAHGDP